MDTSIEALHAEYIISGETYLFCVDNDLQTLQDVADCFSNGIGVCSARVRFEIESLLECYCSQQHVIKENDQHNIERRQSEYLRLKKECSTRAQNALNYLERWLGFPDDYFWSYLLDKKNSQYNFKQIKNVGKKTVDELLQLVDEILEICGAAVVPLPQIGVISESCRCKISELDDIQLELYAFTIKQEMSKLSVRSKNALMLFASKYGDSVVELYQALHSPDFDPLGMRNVGKVSVDEILTFIQKMDELLDEFISSDEHEKQGQMIKVNSLQQSFGLTAQEARSIVEEYPDIVKPPLFKIIDILIRRNDRNWSIVSGSLNIFKDQTLTDRKIIAVNTGLSTERVRQLRNKIYNNLCYSLRIWGMNKSEYDFSHYLDYCRMEYNDQHHDRLNMVEQVCFNSNFIYRVLSLFFAERYMIIGDETSAFMEPHKKGSNLSIVPVELSQVFDFDGFANDLGSRINSKVYEEYAIDLKEYLLRFFKEDIHFDKMPTLLELCCQIIHRNFGIVTIDNTVTIEQNATKTIPEILEEILSEKGKAMSLDEIYEQFVARNPNYSRDKDSLRGNIGRNSNIVPVSRTSVYVLKEWEKKGIKGGTIRDIIFDFLVDHDCPVSIDEITDHVLLFRKGTNEKSVYSNMFADNTKRFSAYEYDGVRLYGLTQKRYNDRYLLIEEERLASKRGFKESIELLEQFIKENGRFPFSSSDNFEEMRLNRFWGLHKSRRNKRELSEEQLTAMKRIEELYGDKEISKKDFLTLLRTRNASMRSILFEKDIDPDI